MDHLESFIADCDRRTELAKKRLAETQEEISAEVAAKVQSAPHWNWSKLEPTHRYRVGSVLQTRADALHAREGTDRVKLARKVHIGELMSAN